MSHECTLQLGESHKEFDHFDVGTQSAGRTAFVLCAGSARTPCKDLGDSPNEDALLVIDEGSRTLLAVADAHYGARASHVILERLAAAARPLPSDPLALLGLLPSLADPAESIGDASETTLLVACLDRDSASGFGFSMGDSTLVVLGLHEPPRRVNRKDATYVAACVPDSLDPRRAREFSFDVRPGELVLAYTDGLNECHYRRPETSVQLHHMESLLIRTGGEPAVLVQALAELALAGIDGNPGGQDNLALVATRV
jgi:serine/threonine protein phosphatase PrpC